MEYFPLFLVHQSFYHQCCIPYPTFAQLLARLDQLQPNFGWQDKLTQPLLWMFGNTRPLDSIMIDCLDQPESLCTVFDIPPAWVLCFCEEALRALEIARAQAVKMHRENHPYCRECEGQLKVCGRVESFNPFKLTLIQHSIEEEF